MKIARNSNLNSSEKIIVKKFISNKAFEQDLKALNAQMKEECGCKGLNIAFIEKKGTLNNHFLFKNGENWYLLETNKNGNVCRCFLYDTTLAGKASNIGKYEETEYTTISDGGAIVVNGLGFSNGYGDGTNTVIVRKFEDYGKSRYHCRAEIYNREDITVIYPHEEVRIWEHDCTPGKYVWQGQAKKLIFKGRKLWVIL